MHDVPNKTVTSHQHTSIMRNEKETRESPGPTKQCNSWFYTLLYYSPSFVLSLAKVL